MTNLELRNCIENFGISLEQLNIDLSLIENGYIVRFYSSVGAEIILICSNIEFND